MFCVIIQIPFQHLILKIKYPLKTNFKGENKLKAIAKNNFKN